MNGPTESTGNGKSGQELYQIVLAVEEFLGAELSGEELAELVNAADGSPKRDDRK